MRYSEILEACWTGYQQQGMKKKGQRQVPNCVPVEEATDVFLDNAAREMMAVLFTMGAGLTYGVYLKIRNKLDRYQGYQIVAALEDKGVTMNRATYQKVAPVLDQFRQALKDNDGAEAKELAKRIEQMIVMGKLSAPEPQAADTALTAKERELEEDLKKWFKEKWVRFGPDGKIRGDCARGSEGEGKPKCLPQSKAHALGKAGRASAAAKKRREDPNAERRGAAKNVSTQVNEFAPGAGDDNEPDFNPEIFYDIPKLKKVYKQLASRSVNSGWYDFQLTRLIGAMEDLYTINADVLDDMFPTAPEIANYIERNIIKAFPSETPPYVIKNPDYKPRVAKASGSGMTESQLDEKQDACYNKVKSRYKVWPSAYASGALVQCRKKGAANWGNKKK